ncbi:hypothetical protein CRG98_049785, partial [Punica granatum]
ARGADLIGGSPLRPSTPRARSLGSGHLALGVEGWRWSPKSDRGPLPLFPCFLMEKREGGLGATPPALDPSSEVTGLWPEGSRPGKRGGVPTGWGLSHSLSSRDAITVLQLSSKASPTPFTSSRSPADNLQQPS